MRVGSIELPDELVDAHAEGRLVLFVGAGASVAEPTCLPNYRELAEKVAVQSESPVCGASLDRPDIVLSKLKADGVDVHARVHRLISDPRDRPAPQPNSLHEAISSLATASPQVRIVTTNYDRCLSDCLPEGVDTYEAHALPEQDEFTGLVYLHGSVSQPPERLIVTGDDLGCHYLVNHGAARFLESMFRNLAVLFIGYSLKDTLMDYLVRGVGSDRLYVLTDKPQASQWQHLFITPIGYESHDMLPGIVQDWADLSRMSMLDHQQRVRRIVSGSPPLTPDDDSYLHDIVSDTRRRRLFISQARGLDWLHWMSSEPAFKDLLNPFAPPERIDHGLAQWFADHYAANDDSTTEALRIVLDAGGTLSDELWVTVARSLRLHSGTRSEAMNRWLPLLVEAAPLNRRRDHVLLFLLLLNGCDLEQDRAAMLLLLDRVLEPTLDTRRRQSDRVVVPLCSNSLADRWFSELQPYISSLAPDLAPLVDRHLRRAHCLQRALHSRTEHYDSTTVQLMAQLGQDVSHVTDRDFFDSISYRRKAIESHSRNKIPCGVDLLIDVARDVLEVLVERSPLNTGRYLESWSGAESALLRRLSVHGWCKRRDVTADEKLEWLVDGDWLGDRDAHHEVMRLIAEAVPSASEAAVGKLIERSSADSVGLRELNRLGWIARHAPQSTAAQRAFQAARAAHPQWDMPDDADFRGGDYTGGFIPRLPIPEADELHELIERGPSEAVALLQKYTDVDDWEAPGWPSAVDALRATIEEHPDDGVSVLEVIVGDTEIEGGASQAIAETVISALSHNRHSQSETERLQAVLPRLWKTGLERFDPQSHVVNPSRWLDAAISHWAGKLTELWIALIASQWQNAGEAWNGLNNVTSTALKEMLDDDSKPSHHAQAMLASKVAFLFGADEGWCRENLLHRFDSEWDRPQAFRLWDGLLASQQLSDDLLEAGLLDYFVGFICQLDNDEHETDDGGESVRSSYLSVAAAICLWSQFSPVEDGWLMKWIARVGPEGRCEWARNVAWMLSEQSAGVAEVNWSRWMRNYWHNRSESIPLALTPDESSAMAEWTVLLEAGFTEAVELAVCTEATFVQDSHIPSVLLERTGTDGDHSRPDHIALEPLAVRDLFAHLLSNSETMADDDGPWNITDAVERLDRALDEDEMKPIFNELLRLGHEEFVSWLQSQERTQPDLLSPVGSAPG
ncbi:MAG: DUF4020 domain-containing protein [Acidimicrobiaceae bacterium]|nr:DUF4020 domain-containing protein [Acidimicrobiaceae bacterium]